MTKKTSLSILNILIGISIGILITGSMFKIMHWPYNGVMISGSKISILILAMLKFWIQTKRGVTDYLKLIFIFLWALSGIISLLVDRSDRLILVAVSWCSIIAWALTRGFEFLSQNGEHKTPQTLRTHLSNIFFLIGSVLLVAGAVFKTLHWPGGGIILIAGLAFGTIWIFEQMFNKEE